MYEIFTILRIISRPGREKTLFLETTDRLTARASGVARRIDVAAIVVEEQEVGAFIVRRSRPIVAEAADIAETAIVVAAITRSRIPYRRCTTELTGEVHAFA